MKVENVYQDDKGNWHIVYGPTHLMGLAIRVYFGQIILALTICVPLLILGVLVGFTFGNSLSEKDSFSSPQHQLESFCHKRDRN